VVPAAGLLGFQARRMAYKLGLEEDTHKLAVKFNGAGLAMATMDIIKVSGGTPANFLDIGGRVSETAVTDAFKILVSDKDVRPALINIFGGIVRCDLVAGGIVKAAREIGLKIPMVVRLEGTNVDLGRKILEDSGLAFSSAPDMKTAAEKVVALAKGGN